MTDCISEVVSIVSIRELPLDYQDLPEVLQSIVTYWRALKGERIGPTWREVDMLKLPAELLPTTVVVDCITEDGSANYRYRFYGSGLRNVHHVELTGKTPDDLPVPELSRFIKEAFKRVQTTKQPVFSVYGSELADDFGDFLNVVRLPLSDHEGEVTKILAVIRYMKHDLALNDMFAKLSVV